MLASASRTQATAPALSGCFHASAWLAQNTSCGTVRSVRVLAGTVESSAVDLQTFCSLDLSAIGPIRRVTQAGHNARTLAGQAVEAVVIAAGTLVVGLQVDGTLADLWVSWLQSLRSVQAYRRDPMWSFWLDP